MYFTESHEWVRVEGKKGVVGITEHAQKELGDVIYVELPKVGQTLHAGGEACVLESTKSASDVYTPVSGIVTAVNEKLRETPTLINKSPEKEGWLFQVELSNPKEVDALLSREKYQAIVS